MKIENNSGWEPVGQAVLLRAFELEEKQGSGGRIHIPDEAKLSSASCDTMGIVVAVGPDAWKGKIGENPNAPSETPRAAIGDKVLFTKYSGGVIRGTDGYIYRMIPCHSIYAVRKD